MAADIFVTASRSVPDLTTKVRRSVQVPWVSLDLLPVQWVVTPTTSRLGAEVVPFDLSALAEAASLALWIDTAVWDDSLTWTEPFASLASSWMDELMWTDDALWSD